jgi:Mce-associated membrane protein
MYVKSSAQLRRALVENKASAHGVVVESAVRSATTDTVEVMLFVDQSVSNVSAPEPRLDRSRVEITMQKVDGRWLASKVQLP